MLAWRWEGLGGVASWKLGVVVVEWCEKAMGWSDAGGSGPSAVGGGRVVLDGRAWTARLRYHVVVLCGERLWLLCVMVWRGCGW